MFLDPPGNDHVSFPSRHQERGVIRLVARGNVGPVVDEELHRFFLLILASNVQWRRSDIARRASPQKSRETHQKLESERSVVGSSAMQSAHSKSLAFPTFWAFSNYAPDVSSEGNQRSHAGQVATFGSIVKRCPPEKSGVGRIDRCSSPYRFPDPSLVPLLPSFFRCHGPRFGV